MNIILKYLWKLIINRKKEYFANQLNTLKQNTRHKENQLKYLQMSAREQIGREVQKEAKPLGVDLAKHNVLSLSQETVRHVVNQTMSDLSLLKAISKEQDTSDVLEFHPDDLISIESACNGPYDIFDS